MQVSLARAFSLPQLSPSVRSLLRGHLMTTTAILIVSKVSLRVTHMNLNFPISKNNGPCRVCQARPIIKRTFRKATSYDLSDHTTRQTRSGQLLGLFSLTRQDNQLCRTRTTTKRELVVRSEAVAMEGLSWMFQLIREIQEVGTAICNQNQFKTLFSCTRLKVKTSFQVSLEIS